MRIGIFGGSFNPIHNGHLRLAREAMNELNLEKVIFVPSYQTPLKKETLLPSSLRVRLLKAALKSCPAFSISLCEIERKGASFTVDTLKYFKKKFGEDSALFFLSGADTVKNIRHWKSFDEVLRLCRFIVMTRPGYPIKRAPEPVSWVVLDALPISSSEIRRRLNRGGSVTKLVPKGVGPILFNYFKKIKEESR